MRNLVIPEGVSWELLIVNNNCTDSTDDVLAMHANHLPLRRLFEPEQGLSRARNRAFSESIGDLILCTDDDVIVSPCWLASYVEASRNWPSASYFGGPILPWFECQPPSWISQNMVFLENSWALRQFGDKTRALRLQEEPFGANMGFLTSALVGRFFKEELGRLGNDLSSGEDTQMIASLRDEGHVGIWVADAPVKHFLPASRLTASYIWLLNVSSGRTDYRITGMKTCPRLFGIPRWVVRRYLSELSLYWVLLPLKNRRWVEALCRSGYARGFIEEAWSALRQG